MIRWILITALFALSLPSAFAQDADGYRLDTGDRLKINVFEEPELSGEFEIDATGTVAFPLIGQVPAAGLNQRELEYRLTQILADGYLVNPRVNVEVLNFRHFFIMGEVKQPGSYPYANGLTVLNAVALAGGYTYRASEGEVMVRRGGQDIELREDSAIQPGDTIRVEERFF